MLGLTLQPDPAFLDLVEPLFGEVDYFEVAPETLWAVRADGALVPNGFHRRFAALRSRTSKPFVAHGVGLSLGTPSACERGRTARWLERIRQDHLIFEFLWYTDHLGASSVDGLALALPLPLAPTDDAARTVGARLAELQSIVPDVGVENTAFTFLLGDPLEEPGFLSRVLTERRRHLLLDLHNLHTAAVNFGLDPDRFLDRLDLGRVIEIHLSGGSDSDPGWLASGRVLRLDAHDGAVPEPVWALLERVLPRCPALRGVTLERMEGTVGPGDVEVLAGELARARRLLSARSARSSATRFVTDGEVSAGFPALAALRAVARAITSDDPVAALAARASDPRTPPALRRRLERVDPDGLRLSALLATRLRFERLLRGSGALERWFDRDPASLTEVFARYRREVAPRAFFPAEEARLFDGWLRELNGPGVRSTLSSPAAGHETEESPKSSRPRSVPAAGPPLVQDRRHLRGARPRLQRRER